MSDLVPSTKREKRLFNRGKSKGRALEKAKATGSSTMDAAATIGGAAVGQKYLKGSRLGGKFSTHYVAGAASVLAPMAGIKVPPVVQKFALGMAAGEAAIQANATGKNVLPF